jgi:hypothetical protein
MANTPGIGTTATRGTRAQRREEAARVVPESSPAPVAAPQQEPSIQTPPEPVAQQRVAPPQAPQRPVAADVEQSSPSAQPNSMAATTLGLEPRKGPAKEILNTRVLASTSKRLEYFTSKNGFAVTDVVNVALTEFFNKAGVPEPDANGNIEG